MKSIALLTGGGRSANAVYNALARDFTVARMIVESPVPRLEFLKKRIKRMGLRTVAGQVAFSSLVVPALSRETKARVEALEKSYEIDARPPPPDVVRRVVSVNGDETAALVNEVAPAVVVIHGTRILSKRLLASLPPVVINIHAGITPRYRGVHGGYWALATNDAAHCGVTVHLVDSGIDTGGVLFQERIEPTKEDNFVSYPVLQLGVGLRLLRRAVRAALDGTLQTSKEAAAPSKLWSHPTIGEYAWNRLVRGVR